MSIELSAKEKIDPPRARLYGQLFADIRVYIYIRVPCMPCSRYHRVIDDFTIDERLEGMGEIRLGTKWFEPIRM